MRIPEIRPLITLLLTMIVTAACNLPRDSDGTLDRVRGGTMRVGVVVDTPWVTDSTPEPGGIESAFVRAIAHDLEARVQWVRGQQSELLETLHKRELDLVIGGLTATSPWKQQVAMTMPFYQDTVAVGGAAGDDAPSTLDGITVAVEEGDPVAGIIRKKGGKPRPVPKLDSVSGPIAAPVWKLTQLHRKSSPDMVLQQTPRVLAASPGENAWLVRVERTLFLTKDSIGAWLRRTR